MGMFSWCTSDTKKSISIGMHGYKGSPEKVYLLNPFGEPYEEDDYDGYGYFGGKDVYVLVALWNAPERCKDEHGNDLSVDEIRNIGISLACNDEDHVKLKYPIKIVETPVPYFTAGISPGCPFQGADYRNPASIKKEVHKAFKILDETINAYNDFLGFVNPQTPQNIAAFAKHLNVVSDTSYDRALCKIAAGDSRTPAPVLWKLIEAQNSAYAIYRRQDVVKNPSLTNEMLLRLMDLEPDNMYIRNNAMNHPNLDRGNGENIIEDLVCVHCESGVFVMHNEDGWHAECQTCGETYNLKLPRGKIVMVFLPDYRPYPAYFTLEGDYDFEIISYYNFYNVDDFVKKWVSLRDKPDSGCYGVFCYGIIDNEEVPICTGKLEEADRDVFIEDIPGAREAFEKLGE